MLNSSCGNARQRPLYYTLILRKNFKLQAITDYFQAPHIFLCSHDENCFERMVMDQLE